MRLCIGAGCQILNPESYVPAFSFRLTAISLLPLGSKTSPHMRAEQAWCRPILKVREFGRAPAPLRSALSPHGITCRLTACPPSPQSGRKTVAHGVSHGKTRPHSARAPLGAEGITTQCNAQQRAVASGARREQDREEVAGDRRAVTSDEQAMLAVRPNGRRGDPYAGPRVPNPQSRTPEQA